MRKMKEIKRINMNECKRMKNMKAKNEEIH